MMVVTSKPFSRAMVNRAWSLADGPGIIDPVDGLSRDNPASVPDLLEALAAEFRGAGFDLKNLIRAICRSQAYQREPPPLDSTLGESQRRLFAARTVRPLLPEQWIASVDVVLDIPPRSAVEVAERARRLLGRGQATPE